MVVIVMVMLVVVIVMILMVVMSGGGHGDFSNGNDVGLNESDQDQTVHK